MPDRSTVGQIAEKVRAKNAGPFWLTIDIFCGSRAAYDRLSAGLSTAAVAWAFGVPENQLKRFDIAELEVIKFSLPRPVIQGHRHDRDMHGAGWAVVISQMHLG